MIYKLSLKSNPKLIVLYIFVAALPAFGLLLLVIAGPLPGLISIAVTGFISYQISKVIKPVVKSKIHTHDDGLTFFLTDGEIERYFWDKITHIGTCETEKGQKTLYIYIEPEDRFMIIPDEYTGIMDLAVEVAEQTSLTPGHSVLKEGETAKDALKKIMGMEEVVNHEEVANHEEVLNLEEVIKPEE